MTTTSSKTTKHKYNSLHTWLQFPSDYSYNVCIIGSCFYWNKIQIQVFIFNSLANFSLSTTVIILILYYAHTQKIENNCHLRVTTHPGL